MYYIDWSPTDKQYQWHKKNQERISKSNYVAGKYKRFKDRKGMDDDEKHISEYIYKPSNKNTFTTINYQNYPLKNFKYEPLKQYQGKFFMFCFCLICVYVSYSSK